MSRMLFTGDRAVRRGMVAEIAALFARVENGLG
jgi:hypothetical protein